MKSGGVAAPALLAASLLAASLLTAGAADGARTGEARAAAGAPPLGAVTVIALDLLWLRADGLYAEGRWPEMLATLEGAGEAAPRLSASWEARGLHVALDLAGSAADPADRDRWVMEGLRILDEGRRRNPADGDLKGSLARVLFDRALRWPSVRRRLRADRGRDPVDETVDLLAGCVAAEPDVGKFTLWLTDALLQRGREALEAAPDRKPVPPAAGDFRRTGEVLRAFIPHAPEEARADLETLARGADDLVDAALSTDPEARRRILDAFDAEGEPPGK